MFIAKERRKTDYLKGLEYLNTYMELNDEVKRDLINMEKGYTGEELFDTLVKQYLTSQFIVMNDLLLTYKGTSFQIDSLIISKDAITIFEVKNYSGEYTYTSGQFYSLSGHEITNPMNQLNRTKNMMRKIMKDWDINLSLEAYVVFINPQFTLYNANPNDPVLLPTKVEDYLFKLNNQSLALDKDHHYMAKKFSDFHQDCVPFQKQLPDYNLSIMSRGITCSHCLSFDLSLTQRKSVCKNCCTETILDSLILDNIKKFIFLFPDTKLTVSRLHW